MQVNEKKKQNKHVFKGKTKWEDFVKLYKNEGIQIDHLIILNTEEKME